MTSPPPQTLRSRLTTIAHAGRWLTGSVTFAATTLGIVFLLWPSLKPEGAPPTKGAELSNTRLDRSITFAQYLSRKSLSTTPYRPADLRRVGAFVTFDFTVEGYKGVRLPLRWELIDARSGDQLAQSRDLAIEAEAQTDQGSWDVWVATPRARRRRLYVQIELYEHRGAVPIARLRTADFPSPGPLTPSRERRASGA